MSFLLPTLLTLSVWLTTGVPTPSAAERFAFDDCKSGETCGGDLVCRLGGQTSACPPGSTKCLCYPPSLEKRKCGGSFDCIDGERCVRSDDQQFCASCTSWNIRLPKGVRAVDRDAETCLMGKSYVGGFTGDACGVPHLPMCTAPRECFFFSEADNGFIRCDRTDSDKERAMCQCRDGDVTPCKASSDCPWGERCVKRGGTETPFCLGCRIVAMDIVLTPIDSDDSRCLLPKSPPSPSPPPPTFALKPYRGGFSWDTCTVNPSKASEERSLTCPEDQACLLSSEELPLPCNPSDDKCACLPKELRRCLVSAHCPRGERCARVLYGKNKNVQMCAGCQSALISVKLNLWQLVDPDDNCIRRGNPLPSPSPSPRPKPTAEPTNAYPRGFTFDSCDGDDRDICRSLRSCRKDVRSQRCGRDDTGCTCFPSEIQKCKATTECDGGERCVSLPDFGQVCAACSVSRARELFVDDDGGNCMKAVGDAPSRGTDPAGDSSSPSPSSSSGLNSNATGTPSAEQAGSDGQTNSSSATAGGEAKCIGAKHLGALRQNELVFASHRTANVLCDAHGSCATPGHMVVFRGRAMRMRAYCDMAAAAPCVAARMPVNSPRWRAARRVASKTDGLEFTALAARWESEAEEHVLRTLVNLGA